MKEGWFRFWMMYYASSFITDIWTHARLNHYDPNTGTFNLGGWEYEYPLTGIYRTPRQKDKKVSFGLYPNSYPKTDPYFWIHNVVVQMNYTITFDEDDGGLSMTADFKILDLMDLHPETYWFDWLLSFLPGKPYPLRIELGTHTIGYRQLPNSNGYRGLTLDGEEFVWWPNVID